MPQLYPCVKPSGNVFLRSLFVFIAFLFSFHTYADFTPAQTPDITFIEPKSGTIGSTVTINGSYFTGATGVSIGGVAAASFNVVNDNFIIAKVASGAASGTVTVTTPGGANSIGGFTFIPPAPVVTWLGPGSYNGQAPSVAPTADVRIGDWMTIIGHYFTGVTAVNMGIGNVGTTGAAEPFTVVNDSTIVVLEVLRGTQSGYFILTGPGGKSPWGYAYARILPEPHIDSFTPTSGATGTQVTIKGYNFRFANGVSFGQTPAASFTVTSDTTIEAIVGAGSTGDVQVYADEYVGHLGTFTYNSTATPIPQITSFTPASGTTGTAVTIKGFNFTGATAVNIGGTPAASFTVVSDTIINAVVAAGTSSGAISVITAGGTAALSEFIYVAPGVKPNITSFTPTSASPKNKVTIRGSNFSGATAVLFGGIPATSFTVTSDTEISAEVSYGATGLVKVVTPGGADSLGTFTFIPAAPVVTWLGPGSYHGDPPSSTPTATVKIGDWMTIIGHYFTGVTAVTMGVYVGTTGTAEPFTVVNDSTIVVLAVLRGTQSGDLILTGPDGKTSSGHISVGILPEPHIDSFTPTSGATGTRVTIKGYNFRFANAVSFGQTPAASFTVTSDTTIEAIVGAGSTGDVQVHEIKYVGHLGTFTYDGTATPIPQITSFTPASGTIGTAVTIKGFNFTGATAVNIGGTPAASFTIISDTIINAVVAAGTSSGAVSVTTANGTATGNGFTYVVPDVKPHITSFTPTSGIEGTVVTIKGSNFTNVTAVSFGGTPATTFSVTDSTITAQLGSGTTGVVQVTTYNGSDTLGVFTYISGMLMAAPNPATGSVQVDHPVSTNNAVIKLTNAMGNVVQNVHVIPGNSQTRLNLSGVTPGIYTIWWGDGTNAFSKRVFIK